MKFKLTIISALCVMLLIAGCTTSGTGNNTVATTQNIPEVAEATMPVNQPQLLLEKLKIDIPEFIVREHVSDVRDYFYKDGVVVGGIEVLDIVDQMDNMDMETYAETALNVIKTVYDTEYDYMADGGDGVCLAEVSTSSRDGKEFYHYFFKGIDKGYDIWMDYRVIDDRDMASCLQTLRSDDLGTPYENFKRNEEAPILDLRMTMPKGITSKATRTNRVLFYRGDVLVGGVEQVNASADVYTLGQTAMNLVAELYGAEFDYSAADRDPAIGVSAAFYTKGGDKTMVHYFFNRESEYYDLWADISEISEENALAIVASCKY